MKKKQRYDPKIYGALKAKFLENLADAIPGFYSPKRGVIMLKEMIDRVNRPDNRRNADEVRSEATDNAG